MSGWLNLGSGVIISRECRSMQAVARERKGGGSGLREAKHIAIANAEVSLLILELRLGGYRRRAVNAMSLIIMLALLTGLGFSECDASGTGGAGHRQKEALHLRGEFAARGFFLRETEDPIGE